MHDDSLGQVVNVKSSTGRATTPQLKRHNVTTPQRNGSAGRSGSAGRTQSSQAAAAAVTTASSGRKRSHLSKRTRQRWENDHLFGLQVFLSKLQIGGDENSKKKNKHEEDEAWNEGLMDINWTSLFHEILLPENSEALKAYLACASSFTQTNSSSPHQMKTFQDCVTEWERAEYSWNNVEKRLRKVIQTAIVNQIEARNFILMIEDILLEMDAYLDRLIEHQEQQTEKEGQQSNALISFVYSIPDDMEHHFARPIRVKYPSKQQQLPVLQITLRDSAYHRLLLHATCQFHGRNSKSYTEKIPNSPNQTFRVTNISSFASRRQTGHHTVSLVPFILSQNSSSDSCSSSGQQQQQQQPVDFTALSISPPSPQAQVQEAPEAEQYEIVDVAA